MATWSRKYDAELVVERENAWRREVLVPVNQIGARVAASSGHRDARAVKVTEPDDGLGTAISPRQLGTPASWRHEHGGVASQRARLRCP